MGRGGTSTSGAVDEKSPEIHFKEMLSKNGFHVDFRSFDTLDGFFHPPTPEEIDAYKHDVLNAIRNCDIDQLHHFQKNGRPLKCSNRFGESILHLACRKGSLEVVEFLIHKAHVPLQVCDDYGRNPLHDACWTAKTNFALIDLILEGCPDLLFIKDKRGYTPLSYIRREEWKEWNHYLTQKSLDTFMPQTLKVKQ